MRDEFLRLFHTWQKFFEAWIIFIYLLYRGGSRVTNKILPDAKIDLWSALPQACCDYLAHRLCIDVLIFE